MPHLTLVALGGVRVREPEMAELGRSPPTMSQATLPRYLIGDRRAIETVATHPRALACGLLFVLSAGFARSYDRASLVHEPWHVLRPLGASLVAATLLFIVVHGTMRLRGARDEPGRPAPGRAYVAVLSLFWMTAPLAWLYAVPYERFLTPVEAVLANLGTLALVSVWRVLLITRALAVYHGTRLVPTFFLVMLFADGVAFVMALVAPVPTVNLMGGIREDDPDALAAVFAFEIAIWAVLSAPIWVVGAVVSLPFLRPTWLAGDAATPPPARRLLAVAIASVVVWALILPFTQPLQFRRHHAERLLRRGEIARALAEMSERERDAYPPHWNLPPRLSYDERQPDLDAVREAMLVTWPADWVGAIYVEKISRELNERLMPSFWTKRSWPDVLEFRERLQGEDGLTPEQGATIAFSLQHDATLTEDDRVALARLQEKVRPPAPEGDAAPDAP